MPEANQTEPTAAEPKGERTFTQAEFDAAFNERMRNERKKHAEELAKFSDYEDFKAKAAKLDELEAANRSELERANDAAAQALKRAEEAEAKVARLESKAAHDALVASVAEEEGVPASLLQGDDEDELRASAQALKAWMGEQTPKMKQPEGGATPAPEDETKLSEREMYAFRVR